MRKLLFPILLWLASAAFAQEIRFKHINSKDGLSQAMVNCILKDSKGFMWFATQDGLNKYDGYSMTVFRHDPDNPNSIAINDINTLYEDDQGIIWIGTNGGGLDAYNPMTNRFTHFAHSDSVNTSISSDVIRCVFKDKGGTYWVGTRDGLNSFDGKTNQFTHYRREDGKPGSISDNSVWSVIQDKKGRLWVGTYNGGINLFDPASNTFTYYLDVGSDDELKSYNSNKVRCIFADKSGMLWLGTDAGGLIAFDPETKKYLEYFKHDPGDPYSISNDRITSIVEDNSGNLWVGTLDGGLNKFSPASKKFVHFVNNELDPFSLSNDKVRCLYRDPQDAIWIGTQTGGVNIYFGSATKFEHYKKKEGAENTLPGKTVYGLIEDSDGLLWIGTDGGICTLDRSKGVYTTHPDLTISSKNKTVYSVYQDKDGLVWVGTNGGGVCTYNKKTGEINNFTSPKSKLWSAENSQIKNGTILSIVEDSKGKVWIGAYGDEGGVYVYDKASGAFTHYSESTGLAANKVYAVYIDSKGQAWIGTDNGGVNILDGATGKILKTYKYDKNNLSGTISSNTVYCFYEDKEGNMWLGTKNGLNKLHLSDGRIDHYYVKDGLPNDNIYTIVEDEKGYYWLSTNKGISRFNPQAENRNGSAFRNYDVNDGLQDEEFAQFSAFRNPKTGEILMGGLNGFNSFFPSKIQDNRHIPPVFITSYKRFGKEVLLDTIISDKRYIELSYKDNFFSFEFASLDFVFPAKNKYSYKMEGVDEDWSPPSTNRYASYTNLSGGEYVLRVRASNNDGLWNEEGATLYIKIIPPFWRTKTFYAVCTLLAIAGVFGFIKWRTRAIQQEKKILEAKVAERTAELAQKNKDITSSIEYAKRIQEAILPRIEQIQKHFNDSFILYRPKDIVSGDFYWFGERGGKKILAVVDCTGHGVPGAFMSMIGHNLLNQIIIEKGITRPDQILNELNLGVQTALKQGTGGVETTDGMDVALCVIDTEKREVEFAGAFRPLVIVSNGKMDKIDGNKFPIGGKQLDYERIYTSHTRTLNKGDSIYMFSDGYADQFGGERGKKFMVKRLNELFLAMEPFSMKEQRERMNHTIEEWKGAHQQVDDILVAGIRL
ncbi:MAG: two-component regulator propeller domain-containing protein [Bacteroidota bacterium]